MSPEDALSDPGTTHYADLARQEAAARKARKVAIREEFSARRSAGVVLRQAWRTARLTNTRTTSGDGAPGAVVGPAPGIPPEEDPIPF